MLECQNIKSIFAKGYNPNRPEQVFVIKKNKKYCPVDKCY